MSEYPLKDEVIALLKELRTMLANLREPRSDSLKQPDIPRGKKADKEIQLRLAHIGLIKTLATLFFGSVLAVVLTHIIKQQQVDMEKARSYQSIQQSEEESLQNYFKYTMESDIHDRLKLAIFFKEIMTNEESRNRWTAYYKVLTSQLEELNDIDIEIAKMENDNTPKTNAEYVKLLFKRQQLNELTSQVNVVIASVGIPTKVKPIKDVLFEPQVASSAEDIAYFPLRHRLDIPYSEGSRRFGASRSGGKRKHAGVNLVVPKGTEVLATENGRITRGPYFFYSGTYAIDMKTSRGPVIRYGGLMKHTPVVLGQRVTAGEVIGKVGLHLSGSSYLVFEMYSGTVMGKLTQSGNKFKRRPDLIDPTLYLDSLPLYKPAETQQKKSNPTLIIEPDTQ